MWKPEEKQTDVRLALQAYHDACSGEVEHVVVVTNDTDIVPALEMIRKNTRACVGLVVPTRNHERIPKTDLAKLAHWTRSHITKAELRASQLPRVLGSKRHTEKPMSWYPQPERFAALLEQVINIRGSRSAAFKWLGAPCLDLADNRPIELIESEAGFDEVKQYVDTYLLGPSSTL